MPFVSTLKESFALAPHQERQHVVDKLSVPNSAESYYYQGLVVLQKLHDEVMKHDDLLQSRSPTQAEEELTAQMKDILTKLKEKSVNKYYDQLEARFQLLAYPFQTSAAVEFLQKALDISSKQQSATFTDQENLPATEGANKLPSVLDPSLVDESNIIRKAIAELEPDKDVYVDLSELAYPHLDSVWGDLDPRLRLHLLKRVIESDAKGALGPHIIKELVDIWGAQGKKTDDDMPSWRFLSLAHLDELMEAIPEIVLLDTSFVSEYLKKLVPYYYTSQDIYTVQFWDDQSGILRDYLDDANKFADRLPSIYKQLKSAIKFHRLHIDITRQEFDEERLMGFLSCISNHSINTSPIPTRAGSDKKKEPEEKSVELPLIGDCRIYEVDQNAVVDEYLRGLITQNKLTVSLESLGAYLDYHLFVKPRIAKIKLTTFPVEDAWIKDLGESGYEALVKESTVSFANMSLKASVRRKPSDTISLFVKTKNIPRLSVRVFQIDTENYWRIHLNDTDEQSASKNINLDGFRPTFEQDFDFSSEPAIRVKYNEFKFGQDGLAPDVFNGRGLWVIEFVGGENQCRAIVQKGYLRHVIQETIAGHVLRVLDEEGQVIQKAKVLCGKQTFETDDSSNILIPYQENEQQKIILVSSADNFCEPSSFHRLSESYVLKANFYMNPEMISFNKTATVVVIPKLTLNDLDAPLSLLDDKMVLTVETKTTKGVKNISTCYKSAASNDTVRFEFMIPEQLSDVTFTLKSKVKAMNGTVVDVSTKSTKSYDRSGARGIQTSLNLRKTADNRYYLQVFGQNGEPKPEYKISLTIAHLFTNEYIVAQLQTNENGIIDLGVLKNIKRIEASGSDSSRYWTFIDDCNFKLPQNVYIAENMDFRLNCNTSYPDSLYSLCSIGYESCFLDDLTAKYLKKDNGYVSISGLPEGKYRVSLPNSQYGCRIDCTVIKPQMELSERGVWSGWLLGKNAYVKQNGVSLQKPLSILGTNITDKGVQIGLSNWNQKTFAIVTTSTFLPDFRGSLYTMFDQQYNPGPQLNNYGVDSTRSLFLNDKRISEEYQYILNRSKAEKWTGSNLSKPTLLVYPKKNADTSANARDFMDEAVISKQVANGFGRKAREMCKVFASQSCCNGIRESSTNLAFLDHNSPLMVIPVSAETGAIDIDRKYLGQGGNLLQAYIISGEQSIFYQQVMGGNNDLKFNDLRQNNNNNKTFIRSKGVSVVLPKEFIVLHTHEYEVIDNFEKLFNTIVKISDSGKHLDTSFAFLKTWPSMNKQAKLETHQKHVCHEFNLWLKKKDPRFFNDYVKPVIKSKLQKTFMDLYLIEEDLSEFRESVHQYNSLSVAEKALLSTSGSNEYSMSVLRSFADALDHEASASQSDTIFDTILAQSTISEASIAFSSTTRSMVDNVVLESASSRVPESPSYAPYSPTGLFSGSVAPRSAFPSRFIGSAIVGSEDEEEDGDDDEDDGYLEEQVAEMREKAKEMKKKPSYKFIESTSEWTETGYSTEHQISLQKFWIHYVRHSSSRHKDSMFLSEDFVYSLSNIKEIWFVLALMDLPFASEIDWKLESVDGSNKVEFLIKAVSHPLLVFYRTLAEYDESSSAGHNQNLMLSQELFVVDEATPIESAECVKINPSIQSLETMIEYGNHLIAINVSSKAITCQVTVQIPTGAVPTQQSSYYQSQTIYIEPYSTWREVVSTFYFPSAGDFNIVPATISSVSGDQLLGKMDAVPIHVTHRPEEGVSESFDSNNVNSQSWPKVAAKGTNESILSYLDSYRKLEKLDLSLIQWRMTEKNFARQVLDVLRQRHRYDKGIWEYGVMHQFNDIIQELLHTEQPSLWNDIGSVFESPLITKNALHQSLLAVYDYYPLFNARAHQMKTTPEILNKQFYDQYTMFLEYLSLQSGVPSDTDLVILVTYLLLQDRIGEAHQTFKRIKNVENNDQCQLQIDYLRAYLMTRMPISKDTSFEQQLDLQSIKDITSKYKDFGEARWRQLFSDLHEFVCEVEQGEFSVSVHSSESKRIRSEPILEFEIDEKEQELVLKYANIKSVDIKYYDMDVEVMFSNNPFMDTRNNKSQTNKNISWIKPGVSETITLPEKMEVDKEGDDDFDMIGVGQVNSLQTHRVPFTAANKNVFVEVSSGNITRQSAYYANSLLVHYSESYGVVRVMSKRTKRPLSGAYVKVYCRQKRSKKTHFWKDGYTGLNGVFDYISVTQGNALTNNGSLKALMSNDIDKLSILVLSEEAGATVKEVYPPEEN